MNCEFTVVVPTYNRAELIGHTLQSILAQTHKPSQVIVVDDGSTDGTEQRVRFFGSAVRYIRIDNGGAPRARNVGVSVSQCPWIAFCDSDDLWRPDQLARQARLFAAEPEIQYSFTNFQIVTGTRWLPTPKFDTSPRGYWDLPRRQVGQDAFVVEAPMCAQILRHQPIFPSTVVVSRSFLDSIGGWSESLGRIRSEDLEFHFRCAARPGIGVISAPVVGIRKHVSNFSGDTLQTVLGEIQILEFLLAHTPEAEHYEGLIREQIVKRSVAVAEGFFALGDFKGTHESLKKVPYRSRSWKLHLKSLIANSPDFLGRFLHRTLASVPGNGTPASDLHRTEGTPCRQ